MATLTEARGLRGRGDNTRPPGDIVVLDYHAPGQHLLLDGVVTNAYTNTRQGEAREIPWYAAKLVEDKKFYADKISERHVAKIHGGGTPWSHSQLRTVGDSAPIHKRSFARLRSALSAKGGGAAPRLVAPAGQFSGVMGRHMYPCGYRGGSVTSPTGSTSLYRGNSLGSFAPSKRQRTLTPRVSL